MIPLLLDPNEFWEHKHNSDVLIPLHIVPHCDLHSQNPVPALEFPSCPGKTIKNSIMKTKMQLQI